MSEVQILSPRPGIRVFIAYCSLLADCPPLTTTDAQPSYAPAPPSRWQRPPIAPDAVAGDALAALCGAALAQISANVPGAARGDDPEYLHQLRVGVRRLLSVLRA